MLPASSDRAPLVERLRRQLARRLRVDAAAIDPDRPVLTYGIDSLIAIEWLHEIEQGTSIRIPIETLWQGGTLADIARLGETNPPTAHVTRVTTTTAALSPGELALWLDHARDPSGAAYNLARAIRVRQHVSLPAVTRALARLAATRQALRSVFRVISDAPVRDVLPDAVLDVADVDATAWDAATLASRLSDASEQPFALDLAPPWRVRLFRRGDETILLFVVHHVIADLRSLADLALAFGRLYTRDVPTSHGASASLASRVSTEAIEDDDRLDAYWKDVVTPNPPPLKLPRDVATPRGRTGRGRLLRRAASPGLSADVRDFARTHGTTAFAVLLAGYAALLHRWTGQHDVVIGCPLEQGGPDRGEHRFGYLVHPLPLRIDVDPAGSFCDLVSRAHTVVGGALQHRAMSPLRLAGLRPAEAAAPELFETMVVLHRGLAAGNLGSCVAEVEDQTCNLDGLEGHPIAIERRTSLMELRLEIVECRGIFHFRWEYAPDVVSAGAIAAMAAGFQTLMQTAAADPARTIADLPLWDVAEAARSLHAWNRTEVTFPSTAVHELIAAQARSTPGATAVVDGSRALDYRTLDARAAQLAAHLISLGVRADTFVGVLMDRSLDAIVAILAILDAGAAFAPLDPREPRERLLSCLDQSRISLVVTSGPRDDLPGSVKVIDLEQLRASRDDAPTAFARADAASAAYLLFTSGSTGKPKGVVNTHAGLSNRLNWMQHEYGLTADDIVLQKTPFTFDVSVWEVLWPLMAGATMVLAPPGGHRDPAALAQLIERNGVTVVHFVPTVLRTFLDHVDHAGAARLSSLRHVFSSGEELTPDLARACRSRLPTASLHNLYGPTEASIDVSAHRCEDVASDSRVPIGRPIANTRLYVLDRRLRPVPPYMPGELFIGGIGLALGYLSGRLTAARFVPDPISGVPGARLYRTGDRARQRVDGTIEYLGRLDTQVKIGGTRIEPGEIEREVMAHPGVRAAIVQPTRSDSTALCCYFVAPDGAAPPASALRRFLADKLPRAMIPRWFVPIDAIPVTPHGKLDRQALPDPSEDVPDAASHRDEGGPFLDRLLAICDEVLGRPADPGHTFFEAGGHSLDAMRVIARIRGAFGVAVPVERLLGSHTLADVASDLSEARVAHPTAPALATAPTAPAAPSAERAADLPLSYEQERLWILSELAPESPAYNVDYAVRLDGDVSPHAIEGALRAVLARHDTLRTTFHATEQGPFQRVQPTPHLDFRFIVADGMDDDQRWRAVEREALTLAQEPFALGRLPLARFRLLALDPRCHVLLASMHHIITDGWSLGPLLRDFQAAYALVQAGRDPVLDPPAWQYADYCRWQRTHMSGEALRDRVAYWTTRLAGVKPTALPTDYPRPALQSFCGRQVRRRLDAALVDALTATAARHDATLYMILLAAFAVLVHRYSGETDLAIATPSANRAVPAFEQIVGFFVNTLVLRLDVSGRPSFLEFLARVRDAALEAYEHSDAPFEHVIAALQPDRDLSRPPLFQIMFAAQNTPDIVPAGGPLRFEPLSLDSGNARYDTRVSLEPVAGGGLDLFIQYNAAIFRPDTIEQVSRHFETLLHSVTADAARPVGRLPMLTAEEERAWRVEWNRTDVALPDTRLETLFLTQADRTPDAIALIADDATLTYADLRARSGAVAAAVAGAGILPGEPVAIVMDKGWEQVAAAIGILRAGCAYVPLDSGLPARRMRALLDDCGVRLMLTQSTCALDPEASAGRTRQDVDRLAGDRVEDDAAAMVATHADTGALAYIIHTSGSTGRPKGVMIDHRGAVNTILDVNRRLDVGPSDRVFALSSLTFDLSVWDIFGTLAAGAAIIMPNPRSRSDPQAWHRLLDDAHVTVWNSVPMLMDMLTASAQGRTHPALRLVLLSGDWIGLRLPDRIREIAPAARVISLGGATEASIWSIFFPIDAVDPSWRSIPYGRPLANQQLYVLDADGGICPVGVAGGLYIGGTGVALGYWRDEARTRASFVTHDATAGRTYRTGDIGRYRSDGAVELLGREDVQVKIDGFRIEPGEIEAALATHPAVRSAVVVARPARGGGRRLVAYVVVNDPSTTPADLTRCVRELLPQYMVPAQIVIADRLPITANGKIDVGALPEADEPAPAARPAQPSTSMEATIAAVVRELLDLPAVDVRRNFFDLGATSLTLVRARHVLQSRLGREVPTIDLFMYPTVASLAAHLDAELTGTGGVERGRQRAARRRGAAQ